MGRRKSGSDPPQGAALRTMMLRGIRDPATVAMYDACGRRLEARSLWDEIAMREIREACLLTDAVTEYRAACVAALRAGDPKGASVYLRMQREAQEARSRILRSWDLEPGPKRGRPPQEAPEDLKQDPEDDGWDTFGADPDE